MIGSTVLGSLPIGAIEEVVVVVIPPEVVTQPAQTIAFTVQSKNGDIILRGRRLSNTPAPIAPVEPPVVVETTPPVMQGAIEITASTTTSVTYGWLAATDNVGVVGYERSINNQSSYLSIGTGRTRTDSGLSPSTTYTIFIRAINASDKRSQPLPITFTTAAIPDTPVPTDNAAPVFNGAITESGVTTTGFTIAWPAADDNIGIAGYEVSTDGTTYSNVGTALTKTFSGLLSGTTYTVLVRARDAAGNRSASLTKSVTTQAVVIEPPINTPPVFAGPAIGVITGVQGVALASNSIAARFSSADPLTYSKSPSGTTWPTGLRISTLGLITGTLNAIGFTEGLKVRATDSIGQSVDSNAFNVTISEAVVIVDPPPPSPPAPVITTPAYRTYRGAGRNTARHAAPKRVAEVEIVIFDFTSRLSPGETILNPVVKITAIHGIDANPNAMIVDMPTVTGNQVRVTIKGGVADVFYAPTCKVETTLGQTLVIPDPGYGVLRVTA